MCHDNFEINSAKLNSFGEADEFSGLAEFISDDLVFHAPLEDGAINGLFRVLRYTHFTKSSWI